MPRRKYFNMFLPVNLIAPKMRIFKYDRLYRYDGAGRVIQMRNSHTGQGGTCRETTLTPMLDTAAGWGMLSKIKIHDRCRTEWRYTEKGVRYFLWHHAESMPKPRHGMYYKVMLGDKEITADSPASLINFTYEAFCKRDWNTSCG